MIPAEKYPEIVRGLLEKTIANKADWRPVEHLSPDAFLLELPNSKVVVHRISPVAEPDRVVLTLCTKEGRQVGQWTVEDGDSEWGLATEFFLTVQRGFLGWDKVLADVERYLNSK